MPVSAEYRAYLEDLFAPVPAIGFKRMFGGMGVFRDGIMFGLVVDDRLFFKVDAASEGRFVDAGSEPFVYARRTKEVALGYWSCPDAALDEPDLFLEWADLGMTAARRAAAAKPKRRRKG